MMLAQMQFPRYGTYQRGTFCRVLQTEDKILLYLMSGVVKVARPSSADGVRPTSGPIILGDC